jgi:hypothetical protein
MKKLILKTLALLFAVTLSLVGTTQAGWFGSDDKAEKAETKTESPVSVAPDANLPAGEELSLSGTIDENSRFIDEQGEIFNLADNDKGMEVKALTGQKVEIKGTVMEAEGEKTVEVTEYSIIE